jgi:hypothetical protein
MNKLCATSVALILAWSASSAFAQSESSRRQTQPAEAQSSAQPYGKCFTGKTKEYSTNGAKEMMADQDCHGRR